MSQTDQSTPGILGEMTIDEVKALDPNVAIVSIGSTEPHGPHLPYGTDVYQVEAISRRGVTTANERGASALKYPTLPISNNVNFKSFPFACRISVHSLMNVVLDIIEALEQDGIRKIIVVNGHGGNPGTLRATLRQHAHRRKPGEGAFVCLVYAYRAVPDEVADIIEYHSDHAGEQETSNMLHLRPDLVNEESFEDFPVTEPTVDALTSDEVFFVRPWHAYLPMSAGGETRKSTPEKGEKIINKTADMLADLIVELDEAPWHELFPYPEA